MATRTQGLFIGCLLVLVVGTFVVLAAVLLFRTAGLSGDLAGLGSGKVGLVLLEGPIVGSRGLIEEIEAHRTDASVQAVVVRINSPGGEVAPSQEIHNAVLRLAAEKPVVASLGSVAASGGYYVAVGADSILADPGSIVGSIGVIFAYPTAGELLDRIGVEYRVFKSGRLKDMGSFARSPTEEEEDVFDSIIADVFEQFVDAVTEGRADLTREEVLAVADGRIVSGRQAEQIGLVDGLGDLHEAILMAAALGGISGDPAISRKRRSRIPLFDVLDRLVEDNARVTWGPRVEYRLR